MSVDVDNDDYVCVDGVRQVARTKDLDDIEILTPYNSNQNVRSTWFTSEDGLNELTKKYVGGKVSKSFVDVDNGQLRKYIGEVTHVHFVRSASQYAMHVSYLSDSDSEDMEEWEIKNHWVGYD